MNKTLVLMVALAFAVVALVGCAQQEVTDADPQVGADDGSEAVAEDTIDANVVAEDDAVELGELV